MDGIYNGNVFKTFQYLNHSIHRAKRKAYKISKDKSDKKIKNSILKTYLVANHNITNKQAP